MESNGEKGRIMVSEDIKKIIENNFNGEYNFEKNKFINIHAAERTMMSYFVSKKEIYLNSN